ncbi:DUF4326 domain-containing protein [Streptosporangium saharense]|uniref:DUF4326 domain-containing protein n=1 Tax=Streptosporangium saharense TaxID=1706840 RepID=A0A7W7QWA9_9ACTN|nr:DUF4326 domain-containing protein [Streptosporangium saharense]MBB4920958.1 hypothetical protein [Streptosporangium saharense]
MTPQRIQRRRTAGWRKPPGAVIVDRTSRWGNPARLERQETNLWRVVVEDQGAMVGLGHDLTEGQAREVATTYYRGHLARRPELAEQARQLLAGRDLACPCSPGAMCHGDVLLEIANPKERTR